MQKEREQKNKLMLKGMELEAMAHEIALKRATGSGI